MNETSISTLLVDEVEIKLNEMELGAGWINQFIPVAVCLMN